MTLMKAFAVCLLYAATLTGANPVFADSLNITELRALRAGDMKRFLFHPEPKLVPPLNVVTIDDEPQTSADFEGKTLLVNFWATWCAPCRHEMPALDALQAQFGGDRFEVVTIATGHNPVPAIEQFFQKANIKNLTVYRDPKQTLARDMSVFGLPMTIIIGANGKEIGRMRGDADWAGPEAITLLKAILQQDGKT